MSLTCKGIYIIGAKRTPFCKFGGSLRDTTAGHAFAAAATDAIQSAKIDPTLIDSTVVANVHYLSQCDGGKTPRYCGLYSGVPIDRPALGVNKACGSGLQAVINGALDISTGMGKVALTGGTEIMSSLPYLVKNTRFGVTLGKSYRMEDYIQNQFPDSYSGRSLEESAEELARNYHIARREVDEYTVQSYLRWKAAQASNKFDHEITKVNIKTKKDMVLDMDDAQQSEITLENLSLLPTTIEGGSIITTGNSSAPGDGAAAIILAEEETIHQYHLEPLARITAWATVGTSPAETGLGAVVAIKKLLDLKRLNINDVNLFEINETFAYQVLLSAKILKIDLGKLNVNGGAVTIGNPVGATGARMLVSLVYGLRCKNLKRAIAASSCGGGQGVAVLLESV